MCTGVLGWSVHRFHTSWLSDIQIAIEGHFEEVDRRRREYANLAAWIINGVTQGVRGKNPKSVKATDLYDPAGSNELTDKDKEATRKYRDDLLKRIDRYKAPGWTQNRRSHRSDGSRQRGGGSEDEKPPIRPKDLIT